MRRPLRQNRIGAQTAIARPIPAPIGGWDTESAPGVMPRQNAVILDNWIPRGGYCQLRRGYIEQVSGTADPVETLVEYRGDPSGDQLLACAGASIYDVTVAGALGSAIYASAATARWNYCNFANDAGRFAILANGEQKVMRYDGATFTQSAFTYGGSVAFDETKLKYVFAHKGRLHLLEKDSLHVWFPTTVNGVTGAVGLLDLGPVFTSGGVLVGGARLTLDGGVGPDDFAIYLTSEGQVAVYQGTDPSDASNWALVGVYSLPKPVGDRCLLESGTDILVLTEAGLLSLTAIMRVRKDEDIRRTSLSARISSAVAQAASSYGANFGWSVSAYSGRGGLILVNVPTSELETSQQYVRCSETGGWCRFTGLNAFCWGFANGSAYFGSTEGVYRWDVGASDNSEPIVADVLPAFQDFGNRTVTKFFQQVRALLRAPSIVRPALQVVTDYDQSTIPTAVQTVVSPGDISPDDGVVVRDDWTGAVGDGYVGAPRMRVSLTGADDVDRVAVTQDLSELLLVDSGGTDHVLTRPNLPLDVEVQLLGFDLMFNTGGQL